MLILNKLYVALTNPIETAKRPRVPPLLKRGDIVMNGDVFRPEEDMFKSCVIHFSKVHFTVQSINHCFSSRRQKANGVGGSTMVTQKPWLGDPDEDFHWYSTIILRSR